MPAISDIIINTDFVLPTPGSFSVFPVMARPPKEASWGQDTFPELGRRRLYYEMRAADRATGLIRHGFKCVYPTLKSVVTDPSGPYEPPPVEDFVGAWNLEFFIHPRSTSAERRTYWAGAMNPSASLRNLMVDVIEGKTVF